MEIFVVLGFVAVVCLGMVCKAVGDWLLGGPDGI